MELGEEQIGSIRVVTAKGRLDGVSSAQFADRIGAMIKEPDPRLLVDFAGIDLVTSAGLRAVLLVLKRVKANGGALALCNVRAAVREVFEISGFGAMLNIQATRADGLAALGG
jgi:stage II sporulation protein AA (anti-sigma F factor antagonist)